MDSKNRHKPEVWESFSTEEIEFSIFDGPPPAPAPKKKAARRNYKDAYFSLSHDIRMAVCRLEDCLSKSDDGRYLAALLADLDSALEQAERKLLSGD